MATIKEDYVSFEVAKLLKEKGFDSPCMGRYSVRSRDFHLDCTRMCNNGGLFECAAPSQAMAMKWLREVYKLYIEIATSSKTNEFIVDSYRIDIVTQNFDALYVSGGYNNYEEACEAAIKYCLENLI